MLDRYSRQTLFSPIGKQGQERLRASSVTIIGCGALGTALANNLCRAGIGRIVIADRDYIELNNLQRQILSTRKTLRGISPKLSLPRRNYVASIVIQRLSRSLKISILME